MAYLTADELRAGAAVIDNAERFHDDLLDGLVAEFEDLAERYRGIAFEPRTATATLRASGSSRLMLPHVEVSAVSAVTENGASVLAAGFDLWSSQGLLVRPSGWFVEPIVVSYTHGLSSPPAAILRACREWVRAKAMQSTGNMPRNALSYSDESGTSYRESIADWEAGRPTGLLVVDEALNSVSDRRFWTGIA